MNKKQLYEAIMRNVSRKVKKALNESFEFEPAEAMNALIAAFNDNRIANVIGNVDCQDINDLIKVIAKMAANELPEKAPLRISSINSLSAYILVKHFNDAAIKEITEMGKAELNDLANCVCQEVLNTETTDKDDNDDNNNNDLEPKPQYNQQMNHSQQTVNRNLPMPTQRQLPECNNQKTNECNCGNKKPMKECGAMTNESLNYRRRRRLY